MLNVITASEARELAKSHDVLKDIYGFIREAAEKGLYMVDIGFTGFKADVIANNINLIIKELKLKGYEVQGNINRSYAEPYKFFHYTVKEIFVEFNISWR